MGDAEESDDFNLSEDEGGNDMGTEEAACQNRVEELIAELSE